MNKLKNKSLTAGEVLEEISKIEDNEERATALRTVLANNNPLAIIVQRIYHPDYVWDLPEGEVPGHLINYSGHDEPGPMYNSLRRWNNFRVGSGLKKHLLEAQFMNLLETVSTKDVVILIAVKDKSLPWETLNRDFVVATLPELFPANFRVEGSDQATVQDTKTEEPVVSDDRPKKEICEEIMRNNPGLSRKEYIEKFMAEGVKQSTAALYYQLLKDTVNA